MKIEKKEIDKSQIELIVEFPYEDFKPFVLKAAEKVSEELKIEGFRPGKVPYEILKQKIGEMTILEEGARLAINKTIDEALKSIKEEIAGQPEINIIKLAPENSLEYKIVVAIMPSLELGDYKNAKVNEDKVEIKEDEVNRMISQLQDMRVKEVIVERELKEGDKAIFDINMYLDKVPVEGGQGKGTAVVIGKNYVIPGFDKNVIGIKKGETREFKLPYPEDYYQKNLAGKLVEFSVVAKEIYERQLPEINDEFAKGMGLKDKNDLKDAIKKSIEEGKKREVEQRSEIAMLEKIVEQIKYSAIPEILIKNESRAMLHELEHNIKDQGGKFEDYLSSIKKTEEELSLELLPQAIKRVKTALAIREIGLKEKIEVTEEEIDKKISELLRQYKGYEKVEERVKAPSYRSYLASIINNKKVLDKLREWNINK